MSNHQDVCEAPTIPGIGLPHGRQRVLQKPTEQDALEMLVRLAVLGGEVGSAYPDHKAVLGLLNEIAKVRGKLGLMVRCPIPGGTVLENLDEKVQDVLGKIG
jgi:hypothetical protein